MNTIATTAEPATRCAACEWPRARAGLGSIETIRRSLPLLTALLAGPVASAQQYLYRGTASGHPNIHMDLYLTHLPQTAQGSYDATGGIYLPGHFQYQVKGRFQAANNALDATVAFPLQYAGTAQRSRVSGKLNGPLAGQSTLDVSTGQILLGSFPGSAGINPSVYQSLKFSLTNSSPSAPPAIPPPPPPAPMDFRGGTRFHYSQVSLQLHYEPNGGSYTVTGEVLVISTPPQGSRRDVLQVQGTHVIGTTKTHLTLSGVPPAQPGQVNNPALDCILVGTNRMNCWFSGMPSLGIIGAGLVAKR